VVSSLKTLKRKDGYLKQGLSYAADYSMPFDFRSDPDFLRRPGLTFPGGPRVLSGLFEHLYSHPACAAGKALHLCPNYETPPPR
jgi:hypothetical protein